MTSHIYPVPFFCVWRKEQMNVTQKLETEHYNNKEKSFTCFAYDKELNPNQNRRAASVVGMHNIE